MSAAQMTLILRNRLSGILDSIPLEADPQDCTKAVVEAAARWVLTEGDTLEIVECGADNQKGNV